MREFLSGLVLVDQRLVMLMVVILIFVPALPRDEKERREEDESYKLRVRGLF